jgi:Amt family ammonium transporter
MLHATSLVMLMAPGLAFFYGGLAGKRNILGIMILAIAGAALYAFLFTYVMLAAINLVTTVRVSEADEDLGLDASLHGERAYDSGAL